MRVLLAMLCCAVTLSSAAASPPTPTPAPESPAAPLAVSYRPPVPGPITAPFSAPASPYGLGHRGVDYATVPGEPVVAAGYGTVTFAGQVAGVLTVVVLHADRLRTTYEPLASIAVHAGDTVIAGQTIGRATTALHFGVRAAAAYLDPAVVLAPTPRARLVPVTLGAVTT